MQEIIEDIFYYIESIPLNLYYELMIMIKRIVLPNLLAYPEKFSPDEYLKIICSLKDQLLSEQIRKKTAINAKLSNKFAELFINEEGLENE